MDGATRETEIINPLIEKETNGAHSELQYEKTRLFGRKIARYLAKYRWYYPRSNDDTIEQPSLDEGWNYFENFSLPRFIYQPETGAYVNISPGVTNEESQLYPLCMSETHMNSFGFSVGLYFDHLRWYSLLLFMAFIINIPLAQYYHSEEYSQHQEGVSWELLGSAICTDTTWQPCPNCTTADFVSDLSSSKNRFGLDASDSSLKFILKNNCLVGFYAGLISFVACIAVIIGSIAMRVLDVKKFAEFESTTHTTAGYSLFVRNPPDDARDPDEWKAYLKKVCPDAFLTYCTIVINNEDVINALVKRRKYLIAYENLLPPGRTLDQLESMHTPQLEKLLAEMPRLNLFQKLFCNDPERLFKKISDLDSHIYGIMKQRYKVSNVALTFEHEQDRINVYNKLSVAGLSIIFQKTESLSSEYLFRGKHVLSLVQPGEPESIHWLELDTTPQKQILQQIFSLTLTILAIATGTILVGYVDNAYRVVFYGFTSTALAITILNSIIPEIVEYLMRCESHRNEGTLETSYLFKMGLFRLSNISFVLYFVYSFSDWTEKNGIILIINSIFITEIATTPIKQLFDYVGNFKRHILGPRAPDQRRMNLYFKGSPFKLAERYTDMNKVVFLAFVYGTIFPAGFLLGSFALVVHLWSDNFCLARTWGNAPNLGLTMAKMASKFNFFLVTCYVSASFVSWGGFPFDDACEYEGNDVENILSEYRGEHVIRNLQGNEFNVTITNDDKVYTFCNQQLLSLLIFPQDYMTEGQSVITLMFGVLIVVLVPVLLYFMLSELFDTVTRFFKKSSNKHDTKKISPPFSLLKQIPYIPMIKVSASPYPLLVCESDNVELDSFELHVGENYNLANEFRMRAATCSYNVDTRSIFSSIKYWPPPISPFMNESQALN